MDAAWPPGRGGASDAPPLQSAEVEPPRLGRDDVSGGEPRPAPQARARGGDSPPRHALPHRGLRRPCLRPSLRERRKRLSLDRDRRDRTARRRVPRGLGRRLVTSRRAQAPVDRGRRPRGLRRGERPCGGPHALRPLVALRRAGHRHRHRRLVLDDDHLRRRPQLRRGEEGGGRLHRVLPAQHGVHPHRRRLRPRGAHPGADDRPPPPLPAGTTAPASLPS